MSQSERKLVDEATPCFEAEERYIPVAVLRNLQRLGLTPELKFEFEAEGLSLGKAVSFAALANRASAEVTAKIGGCEAVTDLIWARNLGVHSVVAPMIESQFAFRKYLSAFSSVYSSGSQVRPRKLINIESIHGWDQLDSILEVATNSNLQGVVVGRGDLAESMGLARSYVDSETVMSATEDILHRAKSLDLVCGLGGLVSHESLDAIWSLHGRGYLDFFETRKVKIKLDQVSNREELSLILRLALQFEIALIDEELAQLDDSRASRTTRRKRLMSSVGDLVVE